MPSGPSMNNPMQFRWVKPLCELDLAILRQVKTCGVPLEGSTWVQRVLRNDRTLCRRDDTAAFARLRAFVAMRLRLRRRLGDELGHAQAIAIMNDAYCELHDRLGLPRARAVR